MLAMMLGVLPVFFLMVLGMALDRFKVLPEATGSILSQYVLKVALPLLLFKLLTGADPAILAQGGFWLALFGGQFVAYYCGYFGDRILGKRKGGPPIITGMSCSFTNAAFMGLPLVASLFPGNDQAILIAGMAAIAPSVMLVFVQPQLEFLQARSQQGNMIWSVFKRAVLLNPIMVTLALGLFLNLSGVGLWKPFAKVAELVGSTSGTCALIALGFDIRRKVDIAKKATGNLRSKLWRQAGLAGIKLIIMPCVTWVLMVLFGVEGLWFTVGIVMSGVATAVGGYVVAESYGIIAEEMALATVLTNFIGLFTVPLLVYILYNGG